MATDPTEEERSSTLDLEALAWDAESLVVRCVGEQALTDLVEAMLDFETFPVFLWGHQPAAVASKASALVNALGPCLERPSAEARRIIAEMSRALVFHHDRAKGLLELATRPRFGHLPAALLAPPELSSRVLSAIPWLGDHMDNRGLLKLTPRMQPQPDVLYVGEWAIPYNQFLRRGFGSRINDGLVSELLRLQAQGAAVRIAIDERRMHPRSAHARVFEFDFWSGPPFTAVALDDPQRRGVDVRWHGWPDGAGLLPWEIDEHASVRTALVGSIRTIEIEEVTSPSLVRDSSVQLVRYVHAERDVERHVFVHTDGAVRFYDRAVYEGRREVRWPTGPENDPIGRRKVFRVDGAIATSDWAEVVAQWFRGNRMILEALAGLGGRTEADGLDVSGSP